MDKWEVFLVISAVVSFILLVCKPLMTLNTTITKLIDAVETLESSFKEMNESNTKTHGRLWNEIEQHGDTLNNHETRLQMIERGGKNEK